MRTAVQVFLMLFLGLSSATIAQAQSSQRNADTKTQQWPAKTNLPPPPTTDAAVDRIIAQEQVEVGIIRGYTPIVQTYLQEVKLDKDAGTTPTHDALFLGQADLSKTIDDRSMLPYDGEPMKGFVTGRYNPNSFLRMIYVDPHKFDKQHYRFDYVGREFLGDVRCVVFDVTPLPKTGKGRFRGRIWAEDKDYFIVHFDGAYTDVETVYLKRDLNSHFDSWRANVQEGVWLPSYIYCQELNLKYLLGAHLRFKAETRLWGYSLSSAHKRAEFASMQIESPTAIQDADEGHDRSAVESKREWNSQAEANVIEGMERAGLLAPAGPVDKVLDTVVNNIEVTNNLDVELHCRVATVGTFELFAIGRMIVVSRGLLDVLPDEPTLAAVLAQGMADAMTPNPLADQYAFSDFARAAPLEALHRYSFKEKAADVQAANARAIELLEKSPYKDKLATAALFLRQLNEEASSLSALISPRLGNSIYLKSELGSSAPALEPAKLEQIAALPVGGRIKMNPWDDSVDFLKTKQVPLMSSREKMPFAVTPLMPYLTRYRLPKSSDDVQSSALVGTDPNPLTTTPAQPRQ
jgi:hypothetical protein